MECGFPARTPATSCGFPPATPPSCTPPLPCGADDVTFDRLLVGLVAIKPPMKMSLGKVIKLTIETKFKSFCKHSSLHGVYYFYKRSGWCVHVLWCMILAASLALCCFLSHMIWEKFVRDPTLTVVESTHYSVANIQFPAVSICGTEQVYLPKTQEITDLLLLRGFNMSEVQEFYKSFTEVEKKGYTPKPFVRKMHSVLDDLGYHFKLLLDMFKRPCNDLIIECNWRSRSHNCSEMFRPVFTIAGHCCQFDIHYFMHHADVETNFISGVESTEALDIIVNGQTKSVDGNDTNRYPVLYVFDSKDKVTLIDSFITLSPEVFFDINVYVWAIDSSDFVKALSLGNRKCVLKSDQGVGADFYQGCMTRQILQRVVAQCNCLPFEFTANELGVEEYAVCTWDRLVCIHQAIELAQVVIREIISESECYQRCDYVQYDTEVELVDDGKNLSFRDQSHSRVAVHFAQSTCMKYRREVLYTWDQMLANLGGIFGLCLGGSVISVIEIIWFLLELLLTVIGLVCKKQVHPSKNTEKNKVFVVSQKNINAKKLSGKVGQYKFVH